MTSKKIIIDLTGDSDSEPWATQEEIPERKELPEVKPKPPTVKPRDLPAWKSQIPPRPIILGWNERPGVVAGPWVSPSPPPPPSPVPPPRVERVAPGAPVKRKEFVIHMGPAVEFALDRPAHYTLIRPDQAAMRDEVRARQRKRKRKLQHELAFGAQGSYWESAKAYPRE